MGKDSGKGRSAAAGSSAVQARSVSRGRKQVEALSERYRKDYGWGSADHFRAPILASEPRSRRAPQYMSEPLCLSVPKGKSEPRGREQQLFLSLAPAYSSSAKRLMVLGLPPLRGAGNLISLTCDGCFLPFHSRERHPRPRQKVGGGLSMSVDIHKHWHFSH
jgi:hypothetical protein